MIRILALITGLLLGSCVEITINGDNNTTTIMMSTMGTATIPVSALPGLP